MQGQKFTSYNSSSIGTPSWKRNGPTKGKSYTRNTFEKTHDILIYGASSFTGRLVAEYIVEDDIKRGADGHSRFILAGRTEAKLQKTHQLILDSYAEATANGNVSRRTRSHASSENGENGGKPDLAKGLADRVEVLALSLTEENYDQVAEAVGKCKTVLNLAGPYSLHGAELLIRACAEQGRHYVDLNGELPWVREMVDKYDFLAWKNRACIVSSCGYDTIPGDITTYLSAKTLSRLSHDSNAKIVSSQTWYKGAGAASGGTVASGYALLERARTDPEWLKRGSGEFALTRSVRGKPSIGLKPYYHNFFLDSHGSFFIMAPHNVGIVRRSWALFEGRPELRTSEQSEEPRTLLANGHGNGNRSIVAGLRYGQDFTYSEAFSHLLPGQRGNPVSSFLLGVVLMVFLGLFAMSSMMRSFLRRFLPSSGEGPSDEKMAESWTETVNVSEGPEHVAVSRMSTSCDAAYFGTARMITECAFALAEQYDELTPLGQHGGVLTPATALGDVLVERLRKLPEFSFWTGSIGEWRRLQQSESQKTK